MNREIIVSLDEAGVRIDSFLAERLEDMSRSAVQRAMVNGEICFADGRAIQKNYVTRVGDHFVAAIAEPVEIEALPQDIPLDVVFEDASLIVVNKPRGMVVHPAVGHPDGTLVNALLFHCADSLSGVGGALRPGIVHRLDKDTSGLILAAKTDRAHQSLSDQLRDRTMERIYEAVAIGRIGQDEGVIDRPIGRHPEDRKRMSVTAKVARDAVTHYTVLARYPDYTHVRCQLETGRTHQIRVHLASIGHPVLGDLAYGRRRPERGISGQCLHARTVTFDHPESGERITLTSELPGYFTDVLAKLGPAEVIVE
ncbi:MAG: RluA family pseudouridine synthase [Oscillospiraceae bacterium]|nr:RluA family pseudouridine synthase [Oscillospiraceae bacterium]